MFEYPHSLSYQATNLTNVSVNIIPADASNIDVCMSETKSDETRASSVYSIIPFISFSVALLTAAHISSYDVGLSRLTVKSTTETSTVGTLNAIPVNFPFNDGITFKEFFNFRSGGLAIYGGIIGAILVGGIIAKLRKLKLSALLDVVAPCFFIGQTVGRWGNFVNQEAFGTNTDLPWGMMSYSTMSYIAENDNLGGTVSAYAPVHPCFFYESLWCILGFVLLHFYMKHRKFDGEVFLMYIGWYGLGRFFIESLRTDSLYLMNIRVSQLVAGTCVLASIVLIIVLRGIFRRRGDYEFFYETETSKQQLAKYNKLKSVEKEKKELKKKIADAKANGESFIELEKEYNDKFGKHSKKSIEESDSEESDYSPILDEELSKDSHKEEIKDE